MAGAFEFGTTIGWRMRRGDFQQVAGEGVGRVSDLIMHDSKEWNLELLHEAFNTRDNDCILAIPLSNRDASDEITWAFSKDGFYTVKSAYMLGKGCNLEDFHQAWVEIWGLNVIPKVRQFLWRLCTNTLPVRSLLKARHLIEDATCPWCLKEEETPFHALFGCEKVKELWADYNCEVMKLVEAPENWCDQVHNWGRLEAKVKQRDVYLAWGIWMDRNAKRVNRWVEEYGLYTSRIYGFQTPRTCSKFEQWKSPPPGMIKISTGASILEDG
ncbi:hypothetical protein RDABS01_037808 [Bienertia sinuspersici]